MAKLLHLSLCFVLSDVLPVFVHSSVNLARNKPASQSSLAGSTKCVDGNRDQNWSRGSCCHTIAGAGIISAWWQVDLLETAEISRIDIYYRYWYAQRFNGYTIRIIKSLDPFDSELCYTDPVDVLPSLTVSHNCSYTGRYVNMSVERLPEVTYPDYDGRGAVINHCELEVYGCPVGFYGSGNCNLQCATECDEGRCNPDDGTCTCIRGWEGSNCTQRVCQQGYYGPPCTPCPPDCSSGTCFASDGHCADGCKSGLYGSYCNKTCPYACASQTCNQGTGNCDSGCVTGYHGIVCEYECSGGCNNNKCYQNNGSCIEGCKDMFIGSTCNECVNGKHGDHCNKTCPTECKRNVCTRNSGICVNGCTHDNMTGSTCNECMTGYFGQNCTSRCPTNCGDCEKKTGHCFSCFGNHYGPTCADCQKGYYGFSCQNICSNFCLDGECDPRIGYCFKGCIDGKYGIFCNLTCSTNCSLNQCHQISGQCERIKALVQSRDNTAIGLDESKPSTNITGPVVGSVCAILIFAGVLLVAIFMIRRFRTRQQSSNYEDATRNVGNNTEQTYEEIKKSNIYINDVFHESSAADAAEMPE